VSEGGNLPKGWDSGHVAERLRNGILKVFLISTWRRSSQQLEEESTKLVNQDFGSLNLGHNPAEFG
jgi:hypothetical protein